MTIKFLPYNSSYFDHCVSLFDDNCPAYFAENEKDDYIDFLRHHSSNYLVCVNGGRLVSAFGVMSDPVLLRARLSWILVSPNSKGLGIGAQMMSYAKDIAQEKDLRSIDIAASHLSAPFFTKYGARILCETLNGWGKGMHRVDMEINME